MLHEEVTGAPAGQAGKGMEGAQHSLCKGMRGNAGPYWNTRCPGKSDSDPIRRFLDDLCLRDCL